MKIHTAQVGDVEFQYTVGVYQGKPVMELQPQIPDKTIAFAAEAMEFQYYMNWNGDICSVNPESNPVVAPEKSIFWHLKEWLRSTLKS
jgi:hypothetical protein